MLLSRAYIFFLSILFFIGISISACSTDSGPVTGWQQAGLNGQQINSLQVIDGSLLAGAENGFYVGNGKWSQRGLDMDSAQVIDFVGWSSNEIKAVILYNNVRTNRPTLFETNDGGNSWNPVDVNPPEDFTYFVLHDIERQAAGSDTLYAYGGWVLKSTDRGKTWTKIYSEGHAEFLKVSPHHPNQIWSGGRTTIFSPYLAKSTNGGDDWQSLSSSIIRNTDATCHDALIHPSDSKQVIVGLGGAVSQANIIRRSQDGGLSWQTVFSGMYTRTLAQSPASPETVYASGRNANGTLFFARSTDFGQTWQTNEFPDSPADITVHDMVATTKEGHEVVYLGTNKGMFSYTFEE